MGSVTSSVSSAAWWRGRWFVRLLSVRVAGQVGDGLFQAGLASYALFSDDQASAGELAVTAAVVLLPYSLLGPWAGVLLDRWSRRQVLLVGNLVRAVVLALLAVAVLTDRPEALVYGGALVALGVNRFLLAGLSAALPHTVPAGNLTPANAVTPTVGTAAFVTGLGLGGLVRSGAVLPDAGDHTVLAVAAAAYVSAAALALRLPRALLGPAGTERSPAGAAHLLAGLVGGIAHLRSRPWPAAALLALTSMRLWFGLVTVSAVLALRNGAADEAAAVAALGGFTVATGAGFLAAALVTPWLARRVQRRGAMVVALTVAAASPSVAALLDTPAAWSATGVLLGLGAQGTKICVDAVLQAGVDDDARGRVFSLYDMAFNLAFVAAAAVAVLVLPPSGHSATVLVACMLGLALTAVGVARTRTQRS